MGVHCGTRTRAGVDGVRRQRRGRLVGGRHACDCATATSDRAGAPLPEWVRSTLVAASEILVDIVRSGFVEGHHRGSVVALTADGSVDWSIGDVTSPIYPRSCNKPVQALGMLRAGSRPRR